MGTGPMMCCATAHASYLCRASRLSLTERWESCDWRCLQHHLIQVLPLAPLQHEWWRRLATRTAMAYPTSQ